MKMDMEKKLEKSEAFHLEKLNKQKDYVYDKIYELKSQSRSTNNYHNQK